MVGPPLPWDPERKGDAEASVGPPECEASGELPREGVQEVTGP